MRSILFVFFFCLSMGAIAQDGPALPAYKRFPTVPALQLLLSDSTTTFTKESLPKKKPLLLMIFSPDCDHCQHEAEQLVANKEAFNDIQIVMATTYPIYRMKEFAETYGLTSLNNVVIGRDTYYLLPSFYEIRNLPFLALYDKKGNLIETIAGTVGVEKLLDAFKAAR